MFKVTGVLQKVTVMLSHPVDFCRTNKNNTEQKRQDMFVGTPRRDLFETNRGVFVESPTYSVVSALQC